MHTKDVVEKANELNAAGKNLTQISTDLGVSRSTLRDWFAKNKRYELKSFKPRENDFSVRFESSQDVRRSYYYLLGQYLGDGYISKNSRTFALRIAATSKYTNIIQEIKDSMNMVFPHNTVYVTHSKGCSYVTINSNNMNKIFPHSGVGRKHERKIELIDWQLKYLEECSKNLARGLFHSDGCLYENGNRKWYLFSNCSVDIHLIFQRCLELNSIYFNFTKNTVRGNQSDSWGTFIYRKSEINKAFEFLGRKS